MKAIAAVAVAVICFAGFAHAEESSISLETMAEVADTTLYAGGRCMLWNDRYICSF